MQVKLYLKDSLSENNITVVMAGAASKKNAFFSQRYRCTIGDAETIVLKLAARMRKIAKNQCREICTSFFIHQER